MRPRKKYNNNKNKIKKIENPKKMRFFKLVVLVMQLWIGNAKSLIQRDNYETKMITEDILELQGVKINVVIGQEEIKETRLELELVTNQQKQLRRMKREDDYDYDEDDYDY